MVGYAQYTKPSPRSSSDGQAKNGDFSVKRRSISERRYIPERRVASERRMVFERRRTPERRNIGETTVIPMFYRDSEITPEGYEDAQGVYPAMVRLLQSANTPQEREEKVKEILRELGTEWMAYGKSVKQQEGWVPSSFLTSYACPEWTDQYFKSGYFRIDPRLKMTLNSFLPFVWDLADLEQNLHECDQGKAHGFLQGMDAAGLRSGVFFSLPSPKPEERFILSFFSQKTSKEWVTDVLVGKILTFGLCLHQMHYQAELAAMAAKSAKEDSELSPLERSIMELLARGLPDKQIADKVSISYCNLDYHLRQLRKRFGARNRVQLAAIWSMNH